MPTPASIIWLNTIGLILGFTGAFALALLQKSFITINPDGTQSWGPRGIDNETWLRKNRKLRKIQMYVIPLCYAMIAIGFIAQLAAIWAPAIK